MKQKVLIFHPALAPYRIDFFNSLFNKFKTAFYFNHLNVPDQNFDQEGLQSKCLFKINYLDQGFETFGRSIRFGIIKIIKAEKPDIVICSEFNTITILIFLYKKIFNKKYKMYTMCDDNIDVSIKRKGIRAFFRNFISKKIDGVILPSREVCDWFKNKISKNIKTLFLPIIHNDHVFRAELENSLLTSNNLIQFENLERKKIILYVGRLVAVKNLFFILKTFAKIRNENYYLVIVGDGILKNKLQNYSVELKISEKVLFIGHKEGTALLSWYNLSEIFVLPSTYEPFGAVVNEALLAGCYVLCSKKAGASSLINSMNGHVFDPANERELVFYLKEKLKQTESIRSSKIELRENKMPFKYSTVIDLFLIELDK